VPWRRLSIAVALLAAPDLFGARPACARDQLPAEIARDLSLPYTPSCALCHSARTRGGPADTPFGTSMRTYGLSASADSVGPALAGLARDHVDSDGDGVGDIDELLRESDPNRGEAGCECSIAGAPRARPVVATAIAAFALSACARRRRANRSRRADVA
jgi:hypothetical protein